MSVQESTETFNVEKALQLWIEITGVDPNTRSYKMRDWEIHKANEVIKKSLEFDKTYVTTLILLENYIQEYMQDRSIPLINIMEDDGSLMAWMNKIHELKSIVKSEEAQEIKQTFKDSFKKAIKHYKIPERVIDMMIEDDSNLAELRYSAFNALNTLQVNQFTQGQASEKKPIFYRNIYAFTDVNKLLHWVMSVESGIALCLIKNKAQLASSHFVFAIRNGGTTTLLSDRERVSHPLHASMSRSRSRGRELNDRINAYHFPYSVMDIAFGDNNRAYVMEGKSELDTLVEGVALEEIKNLEYADEQAWIVMMFSLLNDKFFKQDFKAERLAYTPQMMIESNLLTDKANEHGLVLHGYEPLVVKPLTHEDVKTSNVMDMFGKNEPTGQHDWLAERYDIPLETFDVLNESGVLRLTDGQGNDRKIAIERMDITDYGDAERLLQDRIYLARYNQAQVINTKIKAEYEEKKKELREWYEVQVRNNLPRLLKAMVRGKFIIPDETTTTYIRRGDWTTAQEEKNILNVRMRKDAVGDWGALLIAGESSTFYNAKYTCIVRDTQASIVGHFNVTNARMLAYICGMGIPDLPELLQHYNSKDRYLGNSILDRIDPMDWAVANPLKKANFNIKILLSKLEFNALCKKYQTGNESFWNSGNEIQTPTKKNPPSGIWDDEE